MKYFNNIIETIGNTPLVRLNKVNDSNALVLAKVETFNPGHSIKDRMALIESIWLQVFDDMGATVTNRMSFGFPFCNLSECGGSFRFTLGIENHDELDNIATAIGIFTVLMQHNLDPTNPLNTEITCNDRLDNLKNTSHKFFYLLRLAVDILANIQRKLEL